MRKEAVSEVFSVLENSSWSDRGSSLADRWRVSLVGTRRAVIAGRHECPPAAGRPAVLASRCGHRHARRRLDSRCRELRQVTLRAHVASFWLSSLQRRRPYERTPRDRSRAARSARPAVIGRLPQADKRLAERSRKRPSRRSGAYAPAALVARHASRGRSSRSPARVTEGPHQRCRRRDQADFICRHGPCGHRSGRSRAVAGPDLADEHRSPSSRSSAWSSSSRGGSFAALTGGMGQTARCSRDLSRTVRRRGAQQADQAGSPMRRRPHERPARSQLIRGALGARHGAVAEPMPLSMTEGTRRDDRRRLEQARLRRGRHASSRHRSGRSRQRLDLELADRSAPSSTSSAWSSSSWQVPRL